MAAIRSEPGFASAAVSEIDEVIQDLPPAIRARMLPDEGAGETLTHQLAKEGARRILARMRGSEN